MSEKYVVTGHVADSRTQTGCASDAFRTVERHYCRQPWRSGTGALLARELGIRHVDTVCISSYDHDNQRELKVLKRAEGDGEGFIVIDDLVDTGGTAVAIREMYPKAHFVTIFAKPAGRPLVDDYVIDIPQDTD